MALRRRTVSVGVCASALENAQSELLAALLAAQVARACAVFRADEVVVVDDVAPAGAAGFSRAAAFFARVLQYMETPQYLRRALVAHSPDLKHAGLLPPLNAPHQPLASEWTPHREGVVTEVRGAQSVVDVGLQRPALVPEPLRAGARVTLKMGKRQGHADGPFEGSLSSPDVPREREGEYWGYVVRLARGVEDMLGNCPFQGGYDYVIGTSERGEVRKAGDPWLPDFTHLLVAFGGPEGLERVHNQSQALRTKRPEDIYSAYINTCPAQGSRTIRTEEAITISLGRLSDNIDRVRRSGDGQ